MATATDFFVPLKGTPGPAHIAVKVWGNVNDYQTAIVAGHGWLDNANTYDLIAPAILEAIPGSVIFSIDFCGHGRSSHAPSVDRYTGPTGYLSDVIAVVDYFKIDRFVAIGHSMGGGVFTAYCAAFPEKVTHFVCIENLGQPYYPAKGVAGRLRRFFDHIERRAQRGPSAATTPMYPTIAAAVAARASADLPVPERAAQILTERGLVPVYNSTHHRTEYTWKNDPSLTLQWPWTATMEFVVALLSQIEAPVLYVFATGGYFDQDNEAVKARLAVVRRKEIMIVDGGHHPHLEDAAPQIAERVVSFLTTVSGAAGLNRPLKAKM
ncbi:Alpha/Beta hydrolase protein [Blastocladiella britannica]|nr:Alpha/Beta hydrolase protein [Blastocladiella britannica]